MKIGTVCYHSSQKRLTVEKTIHIYDITCTPFKPKMSIGEFFEDATVSRIAIFFFCILTFWSLRDAVILATTLNKLIPLLTFVNYKISFIYARRKHTDKLGTLKQPKFIVVMNVWIKRRAFSCSACSDHWAFRN
jgi:hypothetical protein